MRRCQKNRHWWNKLKKGHKYLTVVVVVVDHDKSSLLWAPPNKYNKEAFNLYKRLERTKENVLLLIYNTEVPPTNNASERALRKVVRKKKQMTTFRSFNNLTVIAMPYQCFPLELKTRKMF